MLLLFCGTMRSDFSNPVIWQLTLVFRCSLVAWWLLAFLIEILSMGRRSISKFYNGKSKSFVCLKEAITFSGSAKDITKSENAYSRKRKNLFAYIIMYGNSHEPRAAQVYETAAPKRHASLSRNSLVTLASSSSRSSSSISIEEHELPEHLDSPRSPDGFISAPRSGSCVPDASVPRSLSMMDLHRLNRSSSSVRLKDGK